MREDRATREVWPLEVRIFRVREVGVDFFFDIFMNFWPDYYPDTEDSSGSYFGFTFILQFSLN